MYIITFIAFFISSIALADLQVFPLRVLLSEKDRHTQISVRHRGKKPMKYRITTVFYKMNADGTVKPLEKKQITEKSADSLFRFSPKQVLLEPNIEQVIRVVLRAPAELPVGEYRTHLHFEGLDDPNEKTAGQEKTSDAQMLLKARMAVAIPVIVRKGSPTLKVTLSNLKYVKTQDQKPAFSVDMKREGNSIPFGTFEVLSIAAGKEPKVVGVVNGVSSYIDFRNVTFPLLEAPLVPGKFKVIFKKPTIDGGEEMSSAETELK